MLTLNFYACLSEVIYLINKFYRLKCCVRLKMRVVGIEPTSSQPSYKLSAPPNVRHPLGWDGRARTYDLGVNSSPLCQLSYIPLAIEFLD